MSKLQKEIIIDFVDNAVSNLIVETRSIFEFIWEKSIIKGLRLMIQALFFLVFFKEMWKANWLQQEGTT